MQIEQTLLEKWDKLHSRGDAKKISDSMEDSTKVNGRTIHRALKSGECNDDVFCAIAAFYTEKEEKIKTALK